MRGGLGRSINALGRGPEIPGPGLEDIGDECLGVPVDEGEQGALDLDHDPVSFPEAVVLGMKVDCVGCHFVRRDRLRPPHTPGAARGECEPVRRIGGLTTRQLTLLVVMAVFEFLIIGSMALILGGDRFFARP